MITTVIGIAIFVTLGAMSYAQIPAEDPEIVEARKQYGKAN